MYEDWEEEDEAEPFEDCTDWPFEEARSLHPQRP